MKKGTADIHSGIFLSIESAPVVKVSAGAASGQFDESVSLQE